MGKVYREPKGIKPPELRDFMKDGVSSRDYWDAYVKAEAEYEGKVKAWARENGSGKYAGEVVRFQVADGYAQYVVVSLRPVKLIHLSAGDGYSFPYVERLTAADLRKQIDAERAFAELFKSKATAAG